MLSCQWYFNQTIRTNFKNLLQIQNSVNSLQQQLNSSQHSIEDAQKYLAEHVVNYNGSVRILPATPLSYPSFPVVCPSGGGLSVIVDWQCIEAMAQSYRQRAMKANASGYANYTSIRNSYSMVRCSDALFLFLLKLGWREPFFFKSLSRHGLEFLNSRPKVLKNDNKSRVLF